MSKVNVDSPPMPTPPTPMTFLETLSDWFDWSGKKSQNSIENFKEMTGLPWWTTITSVTIGIRLIIFPLRLRAWQNGKMMKMTLEYCNKQIAPKLREYHRINTVPELRAESFKADMLKSHREALKLLNLSPWKSLSPIPVSIPLFLSVAAGLRKIDYCGEGLGMIWRNFGEASLISAIPVFCGNFLFLEYSRRLQKDKPQQSDKLKPWKKLRQNLPLILGHSVNACSLLLLSQVPSGVNLFLFTSSIFNLIETRYLASSKNEYKVEEEKLKKTIP